MNRIALLAALALAPLANAAGPIPMTVGLPTPRAIEYAPMPQMATYTPLPSMEDMTPGPDQKTLGIYNMGNGELQFQETYGDGKGGVEYYDYSGYDADYHDHHDY
ncbi:hypothetical protein NL64_06250 [Pseudomonas fluorescens]|uniref:hypothetical protein n=1 Tax=Pseudomonas fluorescens TaxID=294 RepID=UPI00054C3C5E|nr:hypothetical protein [Pseudomonas fluorescens]KII34860.1 hypothetical protein NL64_06250 [Pseudomonas fluorescens]